MQNYCCWLPGIIYSTIKLFELTIQCFFTNRKIKTYKFKACLLRKMVYNNTFFQTLEIE